MQVQAPDDRYLPSTGEYVKAGQWVEVDPDAGASLVEQGWKSMRSAAAKKAAAKKAAEETEPETADEENV